MIEYLVGGSKPKERLTPNSVPISSILFSENYSKIIFHIFYEENTNNLCAIEIDNDIIIGTKYAKSTPYEIIFEKNKHYFDYLEIQEVIKQAGDDKSLYWSNITYVKIIYQNTTYEMGTKKPVGIVKLHDAQNVLLEYDFLTPIIVEKPFIISGIITHNAGISSIQIIELDEMIKLNKNNNFNEEIFYNRGSVGIIEGKNCNEFKLEHMIMKHNVICYENSESIQLLQLLYERMRNWTNGKSIISTYYPKFLSLIDEAMIEREFDVIHSILRLERYLKSLIQRENLIFDKHKKYQEDLGLTVKLYNVWKPLANSMRLVKQIHNADVELNCYQIAYLSNSNINYMYAMVTIICQVSLLVLLGLSLLKVNINHIFPLYEGRIIIPIIFIFTHFVVKKQVSNTMNFRELFPDMNHTFLGFCDLFSNVVCSGLVLLLNFFVLAFSDSLIDIILNSLSALFIIELDDTMVFISNNAKDDLYKQKVVSLFNKSLKEINEIYFWASTWKYNNINKLNSESFEVNRNLCEIIEKDDGLAPEDKGKDVSVQRNKCHTKSVKDVDNVNIEIV